MKSIPKKCIEKKENVFYDSKKKRYYVKLKCPYCGKVCYNSLAGYKKYNTGFCDASCSKLYIHKLKHPKSCNIMKKKDNNFYYLIGFITADGHICYPTAYKSARTYFVAIEQNKKDKGLIERFQRLYDGSITFSKKKCYKWCIHNQELVEYLRDEVGLTHNKSTSLNINKDWFYGLSKEHRNHFLRGLFDGDGCVSLAKTTRYMSICSYAPKFRNMLYEYFTNQGAICSLTNHPRQELLFSGRNGITPFLDIFTCNNDLLYMPRKLEKYVELCQYYISKPHYRNIKITPELFIGKDYASKVLCDQVNQTV